MSFWRKLKVRNLHLSPSLGLLTLEFVNIVCLPSAPTHFDYVSNHVHLISSIDYNQPVHKVYIWIVDLKEIWPSHKLWGIIINYYKSVNNMFQSIWIISDNIIIIISTSLSMVHSVWQNYFWNSNKCKKNTRINSGHF